jgi:colanic acid/amylovoran biosynthesis protein
MLTKLLTARANFSTRFGSVLAGAAPDTGNLGVSALCYSVLAGLRARGIRRATVLDHSPGVSSLRDWDGFARRAGAYRTRRWYRSESHAAIGLAMRTGFRQLPTAGELLGCDAILDISGGDSFTDLYGPERFESVAWPKRVAIRHGKPLILLPQTYGPFTDPTWKTEASRIARGAHACWARDQRSYEILLQLLGDAFDPARHRCGVDVAFLLPIVEPRSAGLPAPLAAWLGGSGGGGPLAGVNVSGLLYNNPDGTRTRYGFRADYRELSRGLVLGLIERGARVVLVPHVVSPPGHYESDIEAAERLAASLPGPARDRVAIAPAFTDPREVKGLIGRCDWFCGTRMHSTIAGLSQGVPTAAVAYSIKTQGVFETCGQGEHVADPRHADTEEVVERLLASFDGREAARASLAEHLPGVKAKAEEQMDAITACIIDAAP